MEVASVSPCSVTIGNLHSRVTLSIHNQGSVSRIIHLNPEVLNFGEAFQIRTGCFGHGPEKRLNLCEMTQTLALR